MITVEFFCGTKSFSKVASELGHDTFTIDINPKLEPDLVCDILDFKVEMLPEKFRHPDVVWASPPCTTFSVASIKHYWINGLPKNEKTLKGIEIVKKTVSIIDELSPTWWFIENPRGMLRKQNIIDNKFRNTITYCKYGLPYQKATDIWNNCHLWIPREMCKPNSPCHVRSPRGSRTGVQGVTRNFLHADWSFAIGRTALARGVIPPDLFKEIFKSINSGEE